MRAFIVISAGFCLMLNSAPSFAANCGDPGVKCVAAPSAEDISALSNECAVVKGFLLTQTLLSHSSGAMSDLVRNNELEMTPDTWYIISKRINQRANLLADSIIHLRDFVSTNELKESILSAGSYLRAAIPSNLAFDKRLNFQDEILIAETESNQSLQSVKIAYGRTCKSNK